MKILILGHKGMLGYDLMSRFALGHEVVGMDVDKIDITSAEDCRNAVAEKGPDCVINAAAYTNVDGCESDKEKSYAVNAIGVRNIAEACESRNIKMVHFSTDYVFDGMKKTPYVEEDVCNPINHYGRTKCDGEVFLQSAAKNYLLVRTSWLYGINGKNFVKTVIEKGEQEKKLDVVDDQIGSPTFTYDLAGAVRLLMETGQTGIFHVTNRGHCSWYHFALKILEASGMTDVVVRPIKSDQLTRPAMRPFYSVLSNQKLHDVTRRTMRPWQLAVKDYIDKSKSLRLDKSPLE